MTGVRLESVSAERRVYQGLELSMDMPNSVGRTTGPAVSRQQQPLLGRNDGELDGCRRPGTGDAELHGELLCSMHTANGVVVVRGARPWRHIFHADGLRLETTPHHQKSSTRRGYS